MATNNASNNDFANNSDGWQLTGGTTRRKFTLSGADISIVGSGSNVYTYPTASTTLAGLSIAQTFTALQTFGASINIGGTNIITDNTVGSMIGTATTQKIGFFGNTPIVQPNNTNELGNLLSNLGLRANGATFPITTSGSISFTGVVTSGSGGIVNPPTVRTAGATLTTTSSYFEVCNPTAAMSLTLPSTTTAGIAFLIKNISTFTVTVVGTIDGMTNYPLSQWQSLLVYSSGTSGTWYIG